MHELGLMTGVMDAAVEAAREAGATRLLGVKVSIGEATEAVEDALVFAFEALAEADDFTRGATLDLTMIRPRSLCLECGEEFEHDLYSRFCPKCDSFATELLAGRELQIDSIEVDVPEA
ncbi:hydrogenase maturation nickel metallochaperone HypA [Adlercreutzia caecimuris]|jgi:hydrogenase nickel incorporation protein HypA/HybF|uniref:hydrogenase maturation nickel metallochaperone HypA/HybF n=1 Tax=Adlercreutzia caecimuris TaxID=671266 RepID=UPI00243237D9|nr:hydrogenase maturation nickel metallochaperone HypA [Adlercreutzia caecimuris]MCI9207086.1 hydrogenase maturation nickel metallochaperone HypA [Adlercreutzia caecimuris]